MRTDAADRNFWHGRRVFLTGHTGFKGSWLALRLHGLGARVTGYALSPPTEPNLHDLCRLGEFVTGHIADIRDAERLGRAMAGANPEFVFHLAAQPLVRESYRRPAETFEVNVIGTVNLLEAVRSCRNVRSVVVITSDKCYENREWVWGYRENDRLGGQDPYSASKGCAELATAAYAASFFNPASHAQHGVAVATARAGNIIGGGDWARDRLVPDFFRAVFAGEQLVLRSPAATRPWQHVLDPLEGYLLLARRLAEQGPAFAGAWNFGPLESDVRTVEEVVQRLCSTWGDGISYGIDSGPHPHEARALTLDCAKARELLGWRPTWGFAEALAQTVAWTRAWREGHDLREVCQAQIEQHAADASRPGQP
jgi:CDP-glucose 4,6-dehydratase